MQPNGKIKMWRWLERVLYLVFFLATAGLVSVYFALELTPNELLAGAGVWLLVLLITIYVHLKHDSLVNISLSQYGYLKEDAFQTLYGRSPVAYLTINSSGRVIESNGAATKLLRQEAGNMSAINFFSLIEPAEDIDASVLKSKIDAGLTINELELALRPDDGEPVWVMLSVFALRSDGQRLISLNDITEKKKVDTAKSEFVALATHQLRTPIAAIRWNVELLNKRLKPNKTEDQDRYINKIERNVTRMVNLINDFLSVSKLEMGNYAGAATDLKVNEFFESILDEFSEKISDKQINLDYKNDPPGLVVKVDERLFHIIVSNLVSNAVKYGKSGGDLTLAYKLNDDQLQIVVADDGIGIPEDEIPNLFSKFYRASNAQSHQTEGTGLGLYIVKQSVEQLDGEITVTSDENEGTEFVVNLPVTVVSENEIS